MKAQGNTVLVTGGGSGIGYALARAFSQRGNQIIVCGRNREKLSAVHRETPAIAVVPCDISRDEDHRRLVAFVKKSYPDLNILINNAGIQRNYSFTDGEDHSFFIDEELNVNFAAQVKLTDRFLPFLMQRPAAAIVNITSALAVAPKQSAPVYCASKAAFHSFNKTLRWQLEGTSVKVFEIIPALVDTDMTKGRGRGKISPDALAAEALGGIESDQEEIRIGKTKILFALHRLLPSLAERVIRHG